ncbi:MAG: CatB-related O-acetyltransferase [Pseudomonadota bacterium]
MHGPSPHAAKPLDWAPSIGFLKPLIDHPKIEIGDYTYYDDPDGPERFIERCVRYHFDFIGDRLIIGRFCALATGLRFIMNGANHAMNRLSTYPFEIFGSGWDAEAALQEAWKQDLRGDTIIENDVWIGTNATILPGVRIGSGAIVGAHAVVGGDVPPYAVAVGNPARVVRKRFSDPDIERLLAIAWWDWEADKITRNLASIRSLDITRLETAS